MAAPTVIALAEAIFVYTDELAADVVEGYLRMQSDEAGERERRRRRLATLLLDADAHDPEAIAHAAELARWPLPRVARGAGARRRHARGGHAPARRSTRSPAPTAAARGSCCPTPTAPAGARRSSAAVDGMRGGPRPDGRHRRGPSLAALGAADARARRAAARCRRRRPTRVATTSRP